MALQSPSYDLDNDEIPDELNQQPLRTLKQYQVTHFTNQEWFGFKSCKGQAKKGHLHLFQHSDEAPQVWL